MTFYYCYNRYRILPKVLQDVSTVDTSVTLFGQKVTFPVGASPTAHHALATPDGELATARGNDQWLIVHGVSY